MDMHRKTIDIDGPVSVIEYGGTGPLAVCVHGLEGSALNWRLISDQLGERHTFVAPDLNGFGYTEPLHRPSTVEHNASVVAEVIRHYGGPALLIGNSMGGLVSLITAAETPELVTGLVLVDAAGPVGSWSRLNPATLAKLGTPLLPGVGPRLIDAYRATRTAEEGVVEAYQFVTADPDSVDPIAFADALEVAELRRSQPWATGSLIEATRSIAPWVLRRKPYTKMIHRIPLPALIVHGTRDDVVQVDTTRWLAAQRPDWTVAYMKGLGHVPMIEAPDRFMQIFNTWADAGYDPRPAESSSASAS
jgi:pimeloyl-ACP methyl ester carboxylesterase